MRRIIIKKVLVNVQSRHSTKNLYIKISNRKKLQLQALVDSGYIHTKINKQLVKKEKIKIEPIDRLFKVFNVDSTKNGEVI